MTEHSTMRRFITCTLYFVLQEIKSRRLRWVRSVVHMKEARNTYKILVGETQGNKPLGSNRRGWKDSMHMKNRA